MIEVTGLIFGDAALQVYITDLGSSVPELYNYSVRLAVRDGDGDHIYQRTLQNVTRDVNILGIIQIMLDELPPEAQQAKNLWMPGRHNDLPLELPS